MTIRVKNLNFFYGSSQALFDINLEANEGDTVVLLGPSGAGKSTLIRTLNLLEVPKSGELSIANNDFNLSNAMANPKAIRQLRQDVGMVFQQYNLFPHRTALENVMEGMLVVQKQPKEQARKKALMLLEKVGLRAKADLFPSQLSGGQQQRVGIARALAVQPDLILLDEPTSALDPELVGEVLQTLKILAQEGWTMIIVTHEMQFAKDVADRVILMADGHIVEQNTADKFFTCPKQERTRQFLMQAKMPLDLDYCI